MADKPHGPVSERFMRHHYGPSGLIGKIKAEEHRCPACGTTKIPDNASISELDQVMAFCQSRRAEYKEIVEMSNKRGLEAKKLSAESHELAYLDVIKAIERIRKVVP